YEADALKGLATRYVQQKLQGLAPQQLSRYLPPPSTTLAEVVINLPRKEARPPEDTRAPTLSAVAELLGDRAVRKQFGRAWERDREVGEVFHKLYEEGANVLLVGESGAGKTTVLAEAVRRIGWQAPDKKENEEEPSPEDRARRQFWLTSGARLIAGM